MIEYWRIRYIYIGELGPHACRDGGFLKIFGACRNLLFEYSGNIPFLKYFKGTLDPLFPNFPRGGSELLAEVRAVTGRYTKLWEYA